MVGTRGPGIELQGRGQVGDGLLGLTLGEPGVAPLDVRPDELGIEPDGLVEVGDGLVRPPLRKPGNAPLDVRPDQAGVEPDRVGEVGDGLVVVSFRVPGHAPVDIRRREPGVEADGLVEVGNSLVVLPLLGPEIASGQVFRGLARPGLDRAGDMVDRPVIGHDLGHGGPSLGVLVLGHQPEPGALDPLDPVEGEDRSLPFAAFAIPGPRSIFRLRDLIGRLVGLQDRAGLREDPLPDPAARLLAGSDRRAEHQRDQSGHDSPEMLHWPEFLHTIACLGPTTAIPV